MNIKSVQWGVVKHRDATIFDQKPLVRPGGAARPDSAEWDGDRKKQKVTRVTVPDMSAGDLRRRPRSERTSPGPRAAGVVVHRGQAATPIAIHADHRYTFGRSDNVDFAFDLERVSRLHGLLKDDGDGWIYTDLGSANGSFVGLADDARRFVRDTTAEFPCRQVPPNTSVNVGAGDAIVLGTQQAWIELVEVVPETALHAGIDEETHLSAPAQAFEDAIDIASRTSLPVFLLGPSGTGKTFSARQIHLRSSLTGPFVLVNCARLPTDPTQLHAELLGHVKGAYTGAEHERQGRFFHAHGGTLFLDEVESLPEVAQGFLLDVLEGGADLLPLGADPRTHQLSPPSFRLISASKAPLLKSGLRRDLCERLGEGHLWKVPTLDERTEDIPGLIKVFLKELREQSSIDARFSEAAVRACVEASWPGQIRELRAAVRALVQAAHARAVREGRGQRRLAITARELDERMQQRAEIFEGDGDDDDDDAPVGRQTAASVNPRALTRALIEDALRATDGNKTHAAQRLGVARNTLLSKMRRFGL